MQTQLFMERMKIDEQLSSSRTILKWIYSVNDAIKKVKQIPRNDVRKYFDIYILHRYKMRKLKPVH